jgi:3-oxoacyl-[acyl-carrier protein] reductase/meso-butanediol dehydrogenase/(S,S)-butanediol dehydrogenase/diacetyl reductase
MRLASKGAAVVVSASPRLPANFPQEEQACGWKGAASVVEEITQAGGQAIAWDCDVTKPDQVASLFAAAIDAFGVPDAVVNNAGTAGGAGAAPILDLDEDSWRQTLDINLNGTFHVSRAAGRAMREAGRPGAIVNISSLAGRVGMANYGAYCASKFAVIGFTQQLALELAGLHIRVNCVCPGSVDTDMMDGTFHRTADRSKRVNFETVKAGVARSVPLRRQGFPEEQAAAIAFLLGPEAAYITGQTLNVDGGVRLD